MPVKEFEPGQFRGNTPLHRLVTKVKNTGCRYFLPELLEAVAILEANNGLGRVDFGCDTCHKYGYVCRQQSNNRFRLAANITGPNCVKSRTL